MINPRKNRGNKKFVSQSHHSVSHSILVRIKKKQLTADLLRQQKQTTKKTL